MTDTHLILHVKGSVEETARLPKQVVRAAISQGQITHSQLIWSPADNAWKQVRELPHLLPSQKLAPAPAPRVGTVPLPEVTPMVRANTGPVPRVVRKATGPIPTVRVASDTGAAKPVVTAGQPKAAPAARNLVVEEDHGSHPLKWVCIGLGVLILFAVAVNTLLVDLPLTSRLRQSAYPNVSVYAHLGAFMQPNVMVIHVAPSAGITDANLPDFLVALAHSTPSTPFGGNLYQRIALTSGWMGQYSFSGYDWKQLGDMTQEDTAHRKEFLLDQIASANGQSLTSDLSISSEEAREAERDKIWAEFASHFISK